jgi:TonB family protein
MSVEPNESMHDVWEQCQGHVVNGSFPLRRCLGSSDHSGVFLTDFVGTGPSGAVLKLFSALPSPAESQLSDWKTIAGLAQPNLIRLFESGRCELAGRRYLYAVMEYADQNLAQLLQHRPLTEDEAREMLLPMLHALSFLHGRGLVHGQLKPTNILAVGDQLKLASDTIRRVSEAGAGHRAVSVYDPPEARDGSYSTAGDIWGLGVSLFEALTRRPPSGLDEGGGKVALPRDFPPTFREIVARCLNRRPPDRPKVREIEDWVRGQSPRSAPVGGPRRAASAAPTTASESTQPVTSPPLAHARAAPGQRLAQSVAARAAMPVSAVPETRGPKEATSAKRRPLVPLAIGAVVVLAVGWAGMHMLRSQPAGEAALPPSSAAAPAPAARPAASPPPPVAPASTTKPAPVAVATVPSLVHEEIPDVPLRARQTIHGHVRVSVRVIVDEQGKVLAARADDPGPSRYFERLALEAAKKWTFPPVDTPAHRLKLVRFEFTRQGAKGHAVPLK